MTSHSTSAKFWRRALLVSSPLIVLVIGLAVLPWVVPPSELWTDGQGLQVKGKAVPLRMVMWTKPQLLADQLNTDADELDAVLSSDGLTIYFARKSVDSKDNQSDLLVSYLRDEKWTVPAPVKSINTNANELSPTLSPDGRYLLFASDRAGGEGGFDLYAAKRKGNGWGEVFNLGKTVNSPHDELYPAVTPNGQALYFSSNRNDPLREQEQATDRVTTIRQTNFDLFIAKHRVVKNEPLIFGKPSSLSQLNTAAYEGGCFVSPLGDFLYFASGRLGGQGGQGGLDIYRTRLGGDGPLVIENLGVQVNSLADEFSPVLIGDGYRLFFSSDREGTVGGTDLFTCQSHEVYIEASPRRKSIVGWYWFALAFGLAFLFALMFYLKDGGYNRLDVLKKCVLLSLVAHVLITMLLSLVIVSQEIIEIIAPEAGMTTAVNLDVAREVEVKLQTRQTLTELPVADPRMNPLEMTRNSPAASDVPKLAEVEIPDALMRPSKMAVQPIAPKLQPAISTESVALEVPDFISATPDYKAEPARPIKKVETQTEPDMPKLSALPHKKAETQLTPAQTVPKVNESVPTSPAALAMVTVPQSDYPQTDPVERVDQSTPVSVAQSIDTQSAKPTQTIVSDKPEQPTVSHPDRSISPVHVPEQPQQPDYQQVVVPDVMDQAQSQVLDIAVATTPKIQAKAEQVEVALADAVTELVTEIPEAVKPNVAEEERPIASTLPPPKSEQLPQDSARQIKAKRPDEPLLEFLKPALPDEPTLVEQPMPLQELARTESFTIESTVPELDIPQLSSELGPMEITAPLSLFQRSVQQRYKLIKALGGSDSSEDAVDRALSYFMRMQEADGHWTQVDKESKPTKKPRNSNDTALTGLASLAFLASDHTPVRDGHYQRTITKALDFLVNVQHDNGDLRAGGTMYGHAIATLALAEAAVMTNQEKYKKAALKGAHFIIAAQHKQSGGWRYKPNEHGDTSVFGWQIMALHSCKQLGLEIPDATTVGINRWLTAVTEKKYNILSGYQGRSPTPAMTAEAVFSRILLDESIEAKRRATVTTYLLKNAPDKSENNFYYWYYGSMTMMQLGGDEWQLWNNLMRKKLIQTQHMGDEREGSWATNSKWGKRGGRVYTTALSTLTLQVYYRYLPMYRVPYKR